MTIFSTHTGLFQYKRLNFGVNSGAEQFQNIIQSVLAGLPGVINISDDILIFGQNQTEHDQRLRGCLQRLREQNLTLNKAKCEVKKKSIEFFGHIFSASGVSPSPAKVQSLIDPPPPTSRDEVRSFLGLATYCARFIPRLATLSEPLRMLTRQDAVWEWGPRQQSAFRDIKHAIAEHCNMAYFNPQFHTAVVTDASPIGLCAMLIQHDPASDEPAVVIALASRSLTSVEQRYSQTEREALAVTWGIIHFHLYLYGSRFTVVTDHKPLVPLFNHTFSSPPARIERWLLKLQQYEFELTYRPGPLNPADYLSRHPHDIRTTVDSVAEEHVNFILENAIPKSLTTAEIVDASKHDRIIQLVTRAIQENAWQRIIQQADPNAKAELQCFANVKDELGLAMDNTVILRDHRLVVPTCLRERIINIAHEGHQGIVRTKQLIREKVWFPNIDKYVEQKVKQCIPCQSVTACTHREPLIMSELPNKPWEEVSVDFCDLPSGGHLLVVIDDYSRFPVVEIITSTSSEAVIPHLDRIFSLFGVPEKVRTDNGPPFNSETFRLFAQYLGFAHRKITPRWPQANGEAERFMRVLKKTLRTSTTEHRSWKQDLYSFLRNYRATPHATTGVPPASVIFNRPLRTRLPHPQTSADNDRQIRDRDRIKKCQMKANAEKCKSFRKSKLKPGDLVLVKRDGHVGKFSSPFDPRPLKVVEVRGSMIIAQRGSQRVVRNSSYFTILQGSHVANADPDELDQGGTSLVG